MATNNYAETVANAVDDFTQQTTFHDENEALLHPHHHGRPHSSHYNSTETGSLLDSQLMHQDNDDEDEDESEYDSDNDDDPSEILKPEFASLPPSLRPNYKLLFAGLALFITGYFSCIPSFIDALVYLICRHDFTYNGTPGTSPVGAGSPLVSISARDLSYNDPRCLAPEISASVGMFQSYQTMINALFGTLTIPLYSSLSDRIGRRPIMAWAICCSLISMMITLSCLVLSPGVSYKFILLGSAIEGFGGSTTLLSIMASSYISDAVKDKHRAPILSINDAIFFGSIAVGPFLGSLVLSLFDHKIVVLFALCIACQVIFLFLVWFWLPESRTEKARRISVSQYNKYTKSRRQSSVPSMNSTPFAPESFFTATVLPALNSLKDSIVHPLEGFRLPHIPRTKPRLRANVYILISMSSMLLELAICAIPLMFLYAKTRFAWTSVENGYFMSLLGTSKFVFLAGVFPSVLHYLRTHYDYSATRVDKADMLLLRVGVLLSVLTYVLLAEAPTSSVFLGLGLLFALGSGNSPVLRNALIKHAAKGKVGELLGLSQFVSRVCSVFLPVLFAMVYNHSVKYRPQLVIEIVAGLFVVMFAIINFLHVEEEKEEEVAAGQP